MERADERAGVADLVVELGEGGSGSLGDGLSRALGDPRLEIGYWLPEREGFVDAAGRELPLPRDDSAATVTMIARAGRRVAAIVHDPAVLDDPTLVTAVSSAARLAAANALQAEVGNQLGELYASRQRLVEAGDEERRRLERRLHDGVERQLTALSVRSSGRDRWPAVDLRPAKRSSTSAAPRSSWCGRSWSSANSPAACTRACSPRRAVGALEQFAAASEVDVNYAAASRAWIDVRTADERLTVSVRDDGVGGARAHGAAG